MKTTGVQTWTITIWMIVPHRTHPDPTRDRMCQIVTNLNHLTFWRQLLPPHGVDLHHRLRDEYIQHRCHLLKCCLRIMARVVAQVAVVAHPTGHRCQWQTCKVILSYHLHNRKLYEGLLGYCPHTMARTAAQAAVVAHPPEY